MQKKRWREVKQPKPTPKPHYPKTLKQISNELLIAARLKAFITDMFMIYTPILYITTYVILDGAQDFRQNQLAIFLCFVVYAIIYALFIAFSGQTPGLRYAQIKLVRTNGKKIRFWRAFIRVFLWVVGVSLLVGIISPFFVKSHRFLWDISTDTLMQKLES